MLPVFVYGTLRPGEQGFVDLDLAGSVDVLGPARVAGVLYDLGDYPGVILGGNGPIHGELLGPRDEAVLERLDSYELYDPADPAGSEYLRVEATTLEDGLSIWIYIYNFPLEDACPIPGGDWMRRSLP
jgi:gamma-glutamylcyclotransferase (GGCT)/AIG2-like uncharacterized protein YtfP